MKKTFNKPVLIENDEWYFMGCFIQKQDHPKLDRFHVFCDTKRQETIGTCHTLTEAKKLCRMNEIKKPYMGLESFI